MSKGGTNLDWSGRVPEIDKIEEISSRETLEVGRWDHSLEELRKDPEVEEAIVAIDSDPPPAAFVRSSPPGAASIAQAATPGNGQQREALVDYHEPPEVDPPPLTYEQVFEDEVDKTGPPSPGATPARAVDPAASRPSMLPWALLILVLGGGLVTLAYWKSVGDPASAPVAVPALESAPAPESVPAPAPVAVPATVSAPAPVPAPVAAPAPVADPAPSTEPSTAERPDVIYPRTGAIDTFEAQLKLARRLKRGARAVAAYRRAIELDPQSSPALAELARLMLARSHTREASELAERATAVDPSNALAWVTLGAARQMRGDRQGARQAYQNCVKLGEGQYVSECRAMLR